MLPIGELDKKRLFGDSYLRSEKEALHVSEGKSHHIKNTHYNADLKDKTTPLSPTLLLRHECEVFAPRALQESLITPDRQRPAFPEASSYIYAGYLFPHYGHFINESLSRLWMPIDKDALVIFLNSSGARNPVATSMNAFRDFSQTILMAAGINRALSIDSFFDYANVDITVPWPLFQTRYSIHPHYIEFLRGIGQNILKEAESPSKQPRPKEAPQWIYLSRSRLKQCLRPLVNEIMISQLFEDVGFTIVYPEEHSLDQQIAILESSTIIAGFAGSAFHTLGFCSSPKKLIILSCMQRINANFALQSTARGDDCLVGFIECKSSQRDSLSTTLFEILPQSVDQLRHDLESIARPRFGF